MPPDPSQSKIIVQPDGEGRYLVTCPREMEWDARMDMVSAVKRAASERPIRCVILDLENVRYINSAGLGAIFALRQHAMQNNAKVVVARPTAAIRRLLNTINMPALLPVVASLDEARNIDQPCQDEAK